MRRSPLLLAALVALVGVAAAVPALADGVPEIVEPAAALAPAQRVNPLATDAITIYNSGALRTDIADRAFTASRDAGGTAAIGRSASLGMSRLSRDGASVQQPPVGWAIPMGTTMLPKELIAQIMGLELAGALDANSIVMGSLTAELRGAEVGDQVDLVNANGASVPFSISMIADDAVTGGTEILMSIEGADRIGVTRLSRVVLWGFESREAIDAALAANDLVSTSIRIRRSWDSADPDSTIGMARTKAELGEFAYRVGSSGAVSIEQSWKSDNITSGRIERLTLASGCHKTVRIALEQAMSEVVASGLENTINYFHANTAGGCYNPRFSRLAPNSSIGFLSRHTWGMAIDTNTIGSCQGCAPPDMDCRTVRIFRKHGFAWGGNFLRPDGMHFEWVGEPRHQLPYDSRYCDNTISGNQLIGHLFELESDVSQRDTFFAEDGLVAEG